MPDRKIGVPLLFTDGGCAGQNPSAVGGSWAWCLVVNGELVQKNSGAVTPKDFDTPLITNNATELLATLHALEHIGKGWRGVLHTDSKITRQRITGSDSFAGIPQAIRDRVLDVRRGRKWTTVLVAGHPTRAELESGFAKRNGLPVSKWNCWCDLECQRLCKELLSKGAK